MSDDVNQGGTMKAHSSIMTHVCFTLALGLAGLFSQPTQAQSVTPSEILKNYTMQSGNPASPARGQLFFTTTHGKTWSCSTCHGSSPTQNGKHAATGKNIMPLAPAFNPERFTEQTRVEKWFRRNCNDVLGRECNAAEKADVLSWLMSIKP
jgi:hypothetical protein